MDLQSTEIQAIDRPIGGNRRTACKAWTPTLRSAILCVLQSDIQWGLEAARAAAYRFDDDKSTRLARRAIVMQDPAATPSLALIAGSYLSRQAPWPPTGGRRSPERCGLPRD